MGPLHSQNTHSAVDGRHKSMACFLIFVKFIDRSSLLTIYVMLCYLNLPF